MLDRLRLPFLLFVRDASGFEFVFELIDEA